MPSLGHVWAAGNWLGFWSTPSSFEVPAPSPTVPDCSCWAGSVGLFFLHTRPQKMNTSSSTLPAPLSILDCTTCTVQQVLCNIQRTSHHPLLLFLSCAPSSRNAMVSHFQSDGLNPWPMSASLEQWLWSKDFAEGVLCLSLYRKLNLSHQRTQLLPSLSLQPCLGPHLLPFCKKKTLFWSRHLSKSAHYIVTTNRFSKHPLKHGLKKFDYWGSILWHSR